MTREEAIKALTKERKTALHENKQAFDMAIKALEQEPCEEHQREFIELVVEYPNPDLCIYPEYRGKPYFSIKYRENGKEYVGFGTYKIEILSQWIKEYFMPSIQPKPKTDVLDKIRAEIADLDDADYDYEGYYKAVTDALKIIDKYKAESEDKE